MQTLLPQWKELRDTLAKARETGRNLAQVLAPATDESSMKNNEAVRAHAQLYQNSIVEQWTYAVEYVKSLEKMIEKYQHADSAARESFNVMGTEL